MSTRTQLASVRQAITAIEGGAQSYSIDGISVTRANLAELYKRENDLIARLAREQGGGGSQFQRGRFVRVGR